MLSGYSLLGEPSLWNKTIASLNENILALIISSLSCRLLNEQNPYHMYHRHCTWSTHFIIFLCPQLSGLCPTLSSAYQVQCDTYGRCYKACMGSAPQIPLTYHPIRPDPRAVSRFAPSQWETALLCNDVFHWLGASLESALQILVLGCRFLKS